MKKYVIVKEGTKSMGMARDYVVSTKKPAYSLETISIYTQKTEFTYSFLLDLVIEIHMASCEMYYWEETENNFYLIKASSYSVWKEKKDKINKTFTPKKTASKKTRPYHSYKSAYKEWLLEEGLCPKYGCVGYAY